MACHESINITKDPYFFNGCDINNLTLGIYPDHYDRYPKVRTDRMILIIYNEIDAVIKIK